MNNLLKIIIVLLLTYVNVVLANNDDLVSEITNKERFTPDKLIATWALDLSASIKYAEQQTHWDDNMAKKFHVFAAMYQGFEHTFTKT